MTSDNIPVNVSGECQCDYFMSLDIYVHVHMSSGKSDTTIIVHMHMSIHSIVEAHCHVVELEMG